MEEQTQLGKNIADLESFMQDDKRVFKLLKEETLALKAAHATPRKSQIWAEEGDLSDEDLLANDR
jgi:DNA gyrase subunit A